MKKSEAIQEITNTIMNALGADPDTGEVLLPNDLSYLGLVVLNKCEEIGMLPPILTGYVEIEEDNDALIIKLWSWEKE